jgi:hypothetical protein
MDKLAIACLKENFEFLDFWEKHGQAAREALKVYSRYQDNGGDPDPGQWPPETWKAVEALTLFSSGLYAFGWSIPGRPGGWESCLNALDPGQEIPDKTPMDSTERPALIQVDTGAPREARFIATDKLPLKDSERVLRVDLSRKKADLLADFKAFLNQVDENRKSDDMPGSWKEHYQTWEPDRSRERAEAWHQLKVWRMAKELFSYSDIAKSLKITQDTAKKAFYKAYELTQGRPYDRERYREYRQKLNTWGLTKLCQTCPKKRTCSIPCPAVLRILDQCTMKSTKEFIGGERDLLENGGLADYSQNEAWDENEAWEEIEKHWSR